MSTVQLGNGSNNSGCLDEEEQMHSSYLGPDLASKESIGIHAACCFSGSRGVFVNSCYCIYVWICTCMWGTVRAGNLFLFKENPFNVVGISLVAIVPITKGFGLWPWWRFTESVPWCHVKWLLGNCVCVCVCCIRLICTVVLTIYLSWGLL